MSNVRWYAAWAVVAVLLIAVPVVAILIHDNNAEAVTADAFTPPSATPTPTPTPEPSPSATPSGTVAPDLTDVPLCSNIWQNGKMLAPDYAGCQDQGAVVKPKKDGCLVSYRDSMWARPGQKVQKAVGKVSQDKHYAQALAHCA